MRAKIDLYLKGVIRESQLEENIDTQKDIIEMLRRQLLMYAAAGTRGLPEGENTVEDLYFVINNLIDGIIDTAEEKRELELALDAEEKDFSEE